MSERVEHLLTLLSHINDVRSELRVIIAREIPRRPREYGICLKGARVLTVPPGDESKWPKNVWPAPYEEGQTVEPGTTADILFGEQRTVEEGIPGLPETVVTTGGVSEYGFWFQSLIINDEDAPHFEITGIYVGPKSLVHPITAIPATRFAESVVKKVTFDNAFVRPFQCVTIHAKALSSEPRRFRAKITGEEKLPLMPLEPGEKFTDADDPQVVALRAVS